MGSFPSERLYTIQLSSDELKDVKVSIEEHDEDQEKTRISMDLIEKVADASAIQQEDEDLAEIVRVSKDVSVVVARKLKGLTEGI